MADQKKTWEEKIAIKIAETEKALQEAKKLSETGSNPDEKAKGYADMKKATSKLADLNNAVIERKAQALKEERKFSAAERTHALCILASELIVKAKSDEALKRNIEAIIKVSDRTEKDKITFKKFDAYIKDQWIEKKTENVKQEAHIPGDITKLVRPTNPGQK